MKSVGKVLIPPWARESWRWATKRNTNTYHSVHSFCYETAIACAAASIIYPLSSMRGVYLPSLLVVCTFTFWMLKPRVLHFSKKLSCVMVELLDTRNTFLPMDLSLDTTSCARGITSVPWAPRHSTPVKKMQECINSDCEGISTASKLKASW